MTTTEVDEQGAVSAHASGIHIDGFGPVWGGHADLNWSLAPFYQHPEKAAWEENAITQHLINIAQERGIREILMPEPVFGVRTSMDDLLPDLLHLGAGVRSVTMRFGGRADICRLRSRQTYGFASGGCPGVCLYYPGNTELNLDSICVVAHAGRDSLFDRKHLFENVPARRFGSVIFAMRRSFSRLPKTEWQNVSATIAFAIPPHLFQHSARHLQFGKQNLAMSIELEKWGHSRTASGLDLEAIITSQLIHCGVSRKNIASLGGEITGDPAKWHSTRNPDAALRGHRNLLLFTRTT